MEELIMNYTTGSTLENQHWVWKQSEDSSNSEMNPQNAKLSS